MCFVLITAGNLVWFILSLVTNMFIATAVVTPKWIIGPSPEVPLATELNYTIYRNPSVGIYTRCKYMDRIDFHCGPFDLDGFSTNSDIYPTEWKIAMFFISLGYFIELGSLFLTLLTCCKQTVFGKNLHSLTGCLQVVSGICVIICIFSHLLGWRSKRVKHLCGQDSEAFSPGACSLGWSFFCAVFGALLCFACAAISPKAKPSRSVIRRVEDGRSLVCIP